MHSIYFNYEKYIVKYTLKKHMHVVRILDNMQYEINENNEMITYLSDDQTSELYNIFDIPKIIPTNKIGEIINYFTQSKWTSPTINKKPSFSIFEDFDVISFEFKKLGYDLHFDEIDYVVFSQYLNALMLCKNSITKRCELRNSPIEKNDTSEIRTHKLNSQLTYKLKSVKQNQQSKNVVSNMIQTAKQFNKKGCDKK